MYEMATHWLRGEERHVIVADIFDNDANAEALRAELSSTPTNSPLSRVTVVSALRSDAEWFQQQSAITAATLAKNDAKPSACLVLFCDANALNAAQNRLHREVLGGAAKLKFERDDEIGHAPYDWIQRRSARRKPSPTPPFPLRFGVEPTRDGPTFVVGVEMALSQMSDIRLSAAAYFPWADAVAMWDSEGELDVAASRSRIIDALNGHSDGEGEIALSDAEKAVLRGVRRLDSEHALLSLARADNERMRDVRATWTGVFGDDATAMHCGDDYRNALREVYDRLEGRCDHGGQPLLELTTLMPKIDDAHSESDGEPRESAKSMTSLFGMCCASATMAIWTTRRCCIVCSGFTLRNR